ncbi:MAG: hypothetical protein MHMPM18_001258 [Marteilia pararefringens]
MSDQEDSGAGGFFIERRSKIKGDFKYEEDTKNHPPAGSSCIECLKPIKDSFLFDKFAELVCDNCYSKLREDKYSFITKSDANSNYLLSDSKLVSRVDPSRSLKYIEKPNTKYSRFGSMKLYLKKQIEDRAIDEYGSLNKLNELKHQKVERIAVRKKKVISNASTRLQREVNSLKTKIPDRNHVHKFMIVESNESSSKTKLCQECGLEMKFENM